MKIEQGKYYRTADGSKVGPMYGFNFKWVKYMDGDDDPEWENDGRGIDGAPDLIAEWTEEPRPWKDLTDAEKGALLLAHHEGKVIEVRAQDSDNWHKRDNPNWMDEGVFRIKPERVIMFGYEMDGKWGFESNITPYGDTHRITFDVIDGKPDCGSIKMEEM